METFGIASVAVITVITYLVGLVGKASTMNDKWIPILCGVCGGLLGAVSYYLAPIPDFPLVIPSPPLPWVLSAVWRPPASIRLSSSSARGSEIWVSASLPHIPSPSGRYPYQHQHPGQQGDL